MAPFPTDEADFADMLTEEMFAASDQEMGLEDLAKAAARALWPVVRVNADLLAALQYIIKQDDYGNNISFDAFDKARDAVAKVMGGK